MLLVTRLEAIATRGEAAPAVRCTENVPFRQKSGATNMLRRDMLCYTRDEHLLVVPAWKPLHFTGSITIVDKGTSPAVLTHHFPKGDFATDTFELSRIRPLFFVNCVFLVFNSHGLPTISGGLQPNSPNDDNVPTEFGHTCHIGSRTWHFGFLEPVGFA